MNTRKYFYLTLFLFLSTFIIVAQEDSTANNNSFKPIFGTGFIEGVIPSYTIETIDNLKIIYSHSNCDIICSDSMKNILWKTELKEDNCNIIAFIYLTNDKKERIKNCDIVFQLEDKNLFGLKSKNGKVKRIKNKYIERKSKRFANTK